MLSTVVWKMRRIAQLFSTAYRDQGLRGLGNEVVRIGRLVVRVPLALGREYVFDVRRGVRTRGYLRNEDEIAPLSVGGDAYYYQPIGLGPLRDLVRTIPLAPRSTTFVDLGAGRGRAVLLAAELGFGRVVGVELDDRLVQEAQSNIHRWRRTSAAAGRAPEDVSIVQGDAATAALPDGPLVVALFNPFGAATLRMVLERMLAEERTSDLYIAYVNPVHADVFEEHAQLVLHASGSDWRVFRLEPAQEDASAAPATAG
jgi:SAM-dependent methyltransferase